jgi:hypothetical protein
MENCIYIYFIYNKSLILENEMERISNEIA